MDYILLFAGFILLLKGADIFVGGAASVAKKLAVPSTIIGLTVVAFGTSAPEAAVSITAGLEGNGDISLGNAIGSNLFNILVVLSACAVLTPVPCDSGLLKFDMPVCIAATALLQYMLLNSEISRVDGIILLAILAVYMGLVIRSAVKNKTADEEEIQTLSGTRTAVYILLGLAAITAGGNIVVDSACRVALTWGVSQSVIGLTIVAIGTSLPELATSTVAAKKGDTGMALGNVIGSNLFNILFIVGGAATLTPIKVMEQYFADCLIMLTATVLIYIFSLIHRRISRLDGLFCLLFYVGYTVYILHR